MQTLLAIESIQRLKYRYFRALGRHDWALLETGLAQDRRTALDRGKYSCSGRAAFVMALKGMLDRPTMLTMHHGHSAEIDLE